MLLRHVFPLFIAHALDGEPIEGRTRLQKMMFLLQQEYSSIGFNYKFHAYDYGPYSSTLQSDVDELIRQGYLGELEVKMPDGRVKYRYRITPDGDRIVKSLLRSQKLKKFRLKQIYQLCQTAKAGANHSNLNEFLKDIYSRYPEYAKFSIFKF